MTYYETMHRAFEKDKAEQQRKAREIGDKAYNKGLWEALPFFRKWLYLALKR